MNKNEYQKKLKETKEFHDKEAEDLLEDWNKENHTGHIAVSLYTLVDFLLMKELYHLSQEKTEK